MYHQTTRSGESGTTFNVSLGPAAPPTGTPVRDKDRKCTLASAQTICLTRRFHIASTRPSFGIVFRRQTIFDGGINQPNAAGRCYLTGSAPVGMVGMDQDATRLEGSN
ncbi:hypothetical protein Bbelb_389720 [Branchiostoma belcheri]|nr:hypothetical protein Bbelb_389720 [Branchiostoma belcheri]